jgi:hypothetical protein
MGGREHTVVRALDPVRSPFSCPSLSLFYSFYNTIAGRRKEASIFKESSFLAAKFKANKPLVTII